MRLLVWLFALLCVAPVSAQNVLISEFQPNPPGTDPANVSFELSGTPGETFTGVLISVESDSTAPGRVDRVANITGTFDSNGLINATIPDLENPSFTVVLLDAFSGDTNTDIDADDDGTADDLSTFGTVLDALGVPDALGEPLYGAQLGGIDLADIGSEAELVFRGGSIGDFYAVDFNGAIYDAAGSTVAAADFDTDPTVTTFGAINPLLTAVPQPFTDRLVHEIQGSTNLADETPVGGAGNADESPLLGDSVRVQGVVTQLLSSLNGFYVQEEDTDADGDAFSSEGIFVFVSGGPSGVAAGNVVTVEGTVAEFEGQTQITASNVTVDDGGDNSALVTPTEITFPTATVLVDTDGDFVANLEAYEGMLVSIPEELTVTELFQLDRFGTIRVSSDGRLEQFTQANTPDAALFTQRLKDLAARSLVFDDGFDVQNSSPIFVPALGLDEMLDNGDVFRMGDTFSNTTGVLGYSEDDQTGSEEPEYRIHQPVTTLSSVNARPSTPTAVGGSLTVASLNVLNFFTTLDEFPNVNEGSGPNGLEPRGADANPQNASPVPAATDEYFRQRDKLVAALVAIDADIVGLVELENDFATGGAAPTGSGTVIGSGVAIDELVIAVNAVAGAGTYEWVRLPGGAEFVGSDAIAVGFIYKPATVSLVGDAVVVDDGGFVDPNATGTGRNRAALVQTFEEIATGGRFTAAVNHFKSKGDSGLAPCDPGAEPDCDQLDGQGFWNDTRTQAATFLANLLATDPTSSGDPDFMILGDLNAYAQEDPITTLEGAGYTDLAEQFLGASAYSFVFDGQKGTLDYALANASLLTQVTGATEWHINADEPDAFDYNLEFFRDPSLYTADPFRASDHDPIIVGLDLAASSVPAVIINEVDADTPGTDTVEFIELYDGGVGSTALDGLVLVLYNGSSDTSYDAIDLDGQATDANGFFVIGSASVPDVDLVSFTDNGIQNGADAVALYTGDASGFPSGTAVTATDLIDALVYDTSDSDDSGLIDVLTPGQTQVDENGNGDKDNQSLSRVPDGGTPRDTSTFVAQTPTPGVSNVPSSPQAVVIINEVDADNPGTDTLEFIELYDGGVGSTALDGLVLVLYNGSSDTSYDAIDLDGQATDENGFFVIGSAGVPNVDLVSFTDNGIQNGADAVALYTGDALGFPSGTAVTATDLIDALVYDTSDSDDSGLIDVLTPGQTQVDENGNGDKDNQSLSRVPDGGTPRDTSTFVAQTPTPGVSNVAGGSTVTAPYSQDFQSGCPDDFTIVSVDADAANTWDCSGSNIDGTSLNANAFGDSAAADDWAVSPAIDISGLSAPVLSFDTWTNFSDAGQADPEVTLQYTDNYTGDPSTTTWTPLSYTAPAPDSETVTSSGEIDLSAIASTTVTFAWRYQSSGTGGGSSADWELDNIVVGEASPVLTPEQRFIHQIQGAADQNLEDGNLVEVTAIVIGDFQGPSFNSDPEQLDGFFIQEEDADVDGNPATSEGIFVFCGSDGSNCPEVNDGDSVTVVAIVDEGFGVTQLEPQSASDITVNSSGNPLPTATVLAIQTDLITPAGDKNAYYEAFESMLVTIADRMVVSEYFQLQRFGQLVLTVGARPYQYTHVDATPTQAEFDAFLADLDRRTLRLGDDNNNDNESLPDGQLYFPQPNGFGVGAQGPDFFRGGDSITNLTGVMYFAFNEWDVRPVPGTALQFAVENTRPAAPDDVGGSLKVASVNVLNYFTTLDEGSNGCGPNGIECRGADSSAELTRQTQKLVAALQAIDADVVGLQEIENSLDSAAVQTLVDELNGVVGAGTYEFIDPTAAGNAYNSDPDPDASFVGTDAITVAIIYKPATVTPVGTTIAVEEAAFVDPNNTGLQRNRPAVIQSFRDNVTQTVFTVANNHFKSKGDSGLEGTATCQNNPAADPDCDQGDGQGFWNDTRGDAATFLVNLLATNPTGVDTEGNYLIIGDLNGYKNETAITNIEGAGYSDMIEALLGDDAYSFVFDGQLGYLDHALAAPAIQDNVTGVTEWHINADEVDSFDYNDDARDGNEASFEEKPDGNVLFEANAFRASDHDPLIVGLDFAAPTTVTVTGTTTVTEGATTTLTFTRDNNTAAFTIDVTDAGGDATAGSDYQPLPMEISFAAGGSLTAELVIQTIEDSVVEGAETFAFDYAITAADVTLDDTGMREITISDDDAATITVTDVTQNEGDAGETQFVFELELTGDVQGGVRLNAFSVDGSASAGEDFTAVNRVRDFSGTSGETQQVTVAVLGDVDLEATETFTLALSLVFPTGRDIALIDGTGTILNDDDADDPIDPGTEGPTAVDDALLDLLAVEDQAEIVIDPATLLVNDQAAADATDPTLTVTAVQGAMGGTVALVGGQIIFTPAADFFGPASFEYTVTGEGFLSDFATVTFEVLPVNDAPSFADQGDVAFDAMGAPEQTVIGWAFGFDFGPGETGQAVAAFEVTIDADPDDVLTDLSVSAEGDLLATLTGAIGQATATIRLRDDGGTADGGVDLSAPVTVTIIVGEPVDLRISKTNGLVSVERGLIVTYLIQVENVGTLDANGAAVSDVLPPELGGALWMCEAFEGAACGTASGVDDIVATVDLPVGSFVDFTLMAVVAADVVESVINTATVAAPPGTVDANPEDNRATDEDVVPIFKNSFEADEEGDQEGDEPKALTRAIDRLLEQMPTRERPPLTIPVGSTGAVQARQLHGALQVRWLQRSAQGLSAGPWQGGSRR